ncbi:MAG: hypothetical protein ACYTXE_44870 [Nostoc sp.]
MTFGYQIEAKLGNADQVGLRLRCNGQTQAVEIHRELRQAEFKVTNPRSSYHDDYTHFFYVTSTVNSLDSVMQKIEDRIKVSNNASVVTKEATLKDFKSWQILFRKAIKKLNNDHVNFTSSVQEINQNTLEQKISAGRLIEVEDHLLRQADFNDGTSIK